MDSDEGERGGGGDGWDGWEGGHPPSLQTLRGSARGASRQEERADCRQDINRRLYAKWGELKVETANPEDVSRRQGFQDVAAESDPGNEVSGNRVSRRVEY